MIRLWHMIRPYIWWTHRRGSVQYDVMVTLILLFIFLAPRWINFKDKPTERTPHQTGVVVLPEGQTGFVYEIDAAAIPGRNDASIREDLLRVVEPIAGEVDITSYEPVHDKKGQLVAYRAHVVRKF